MARPERVDTDAAAAAAAAARIRPEMLRPLRFTPHVLFVLALAVGLAFGLATQFPQAEIIERAEDWPLIGPLAERFRRAYVPPPPSMPAASQEVDPTVAQKPQVEVVQVIDPDMVGRKPKVWAPAGTPIFAEPELDSRELGRVEHLFPLSRLERRGDWFRVRFGTRRAGFAKGWVHLPDYREPAVAELNAPAPVLPLAPVPIAAEALAEARQRMTATASEGMCGPFRLLTDTTDTEVLAMCESVGAGIEQAHRQRYGLELVGVAAETILLFGSAAAFRAFRDRVASGLSGEAFASAARGFVALPVGGASVAEVEAHLIHELTHLLNRRSLGPALPPWLDEGMARDLDRRGVGASAVAPSGVFAGPAVAPLEVLFELDRQVFQQQSQENYRAAGRWMEFLIAGPDPALGRGMRSFLRAVSRGDPITADLLLDHLGRDWSALEKAFRQWEGGGSHLAAQ